MTDLHADFDALTSAGGAVWLSREVVRVSGSDAMSYLQGQVTQDISGLAVGASTWSFVLQPHGKVDGFVRISRVGDDEVLLDTDRGQAAELITRLERFRMRLDVVIEPLNWKVLAVRGDVEAPASPGDVVVAPVNWRGMHGFDLLGDDPSVPDGIREVDYEAYEALRIVNGFPTMGAELDQLTIPAEAGANDFAISFTKGCYTGQELVARIDARGGNVPRHLRAIVFTCDEHIPRGATVMPVGKAVNAKPLGTLSSVAYCPPLDRYVALGMIRRDAIAPVDAVIIWDDGPTSCRIEPLPLAL